MLGREAEADDRDIGLLSRGHRPDLLDVDLASDHVVPEPDHNLSEQLEPVSLLVRDQDPEMLRLGLHHSSVFSALLRALERNRDPRTPNALRNTGDLTPHAVRPNGQV